MIKFSPSVLDENGFYSYTASGDNSRGTCSARLEGAKVTLISIEGTQGDAYVIEGLIRSALNFAANRNAYTAYVSPGNMDADAIAVLMMLGFAEENNFLVCDIPDALRGSCSRCK